MSSLKITVYLTTLFMVVYVLLTQLSVPFPLQFSAFLISQILLLRMVFRILKDPYKTKKTFADWYEDKEVRSN